MLSMNGWEMNNNFIVGAVVIFLVVSASYLFANRYTIVPTSERPAAYVLDGWTGKTKIASHSEEFE